jgi:uncharacterized protein (DUF305 family)
MTAAGSASRLDEPLPLIAGADDASTARSVGADTGGGRPPTGDDVVPTDEWPAPWWHAPWRLAVLALALLFLGGAMGYALLARAGTPAAESVDVGFLQDMRVHHDQAVLMSLLLLDKPAAEGERSVRTLAQEVVLGQQLESGLMVQLLRTWGHREANETDTGMVWMDMATPLDRMPGLATPADLDALRAASGSEADALWLGLMIAHHDGGVHMAEHAAEHAGTDDVRELAAAMAAGQRGEIVELQDALRDVTGS